MTITSIDRGHKAVYTNNRWIYADNLKPLMEHRPCAKCGKQPTKDGHDSCLGTLPNVINACCGHGKEKPFTMENTDD